MKAFIQAVLVSTVAIVLSLFCLEIGVRLYFGVPLFHFDNFVALDLDKMHRPGSVGATYDPLVGWVQRDNVQVTTPPTFTTGQYGARMATTTIRPLQQNAILVVGDSFATGSDVSDDETWPAALEQKIGTAVINAGVGGYGFDQIVLRAETLVPKLKPRMVLVQTRTGFGLAANRMSIYSGAPKPFFKVQNGEAVLHNVPVPRHASRAELGWKRQVFGYSYLVHLIMTRLDKLQWWVAAGLGNQQVSSNDESVEIECLLMKRLATLKANARIPLLLVTQYAADEGMQRELAWKSDQLKINACAKRAGIDIVDTLNVIKSRFDAEGIEAYKTLWVMSPDGTLFGHMSKVGNDLIAKQIAEHLKSDKILSAIQ